MPEPVAPPSETLEAPPPITIAPGKRRDSRAATRAATRGGIAMIAALGASTVVLAGLLAGTMLLRGELMAAWPPSQRLFGWLGLG